MVPEPILTLPLRSCRDLLQARHHARRLARLLRFSPQETTCIAAGAFVVAQQGRALLRRAELCFALVDEHLRVFARAKSRAVRATLAPQGSSTSEGLYVLSKPLPRGEQPLAVDDIAWVIAQVGQLVPATLQEEIACQNQEVLALLALLGSGQTVSQSSQNPSAA